MSSQLSIKPEKVKRRHQRRRYAHPGQSSTREDEAQMAAMKTEPISSSAHALRSKQQKKYEKNKRLKPNNLIQNQTEEDTKVAIVEESITAVTRAPLNALPSIFVRRKATLPRSADRRRKCLTSTPVKTPLHDIGSIISSKVCQLSTANPQNY